MKKIVKKQKTEPVGFASASYRIIKSPGKVGRGDRIGFGNRLFGIADNDAQKGEDLYVCISGHWYGEINKKLHMVSLKYGSMYAASKTKKNC